MADGQYGITGDGAVRAAVARQLADYVRRAQRISVDIKDEDDTAVLLATVLAVEAVQYERGQAQFNPHALLSLLNPFNWLLPSSYERRRGERLPRRLLKIAGHLRLS